MRWPWTRSKLELNRESRKTESTRTNMHVLLGRLEQAVDRLEHILEEQQGGRYEESRGS